eukprot:4405747-Prymnesium_polylepis.1
MLVLAMSAGVVGGGVAGWEREERTLFVTDDSAQLLCVRWSRYEAEPLPRLMLGHPLVLINARYKGTDAFVSPPGCEALLQGSTWTVHIAEANTTAQHPAVFTGRAVGAAAHVKPQLERLQQLVDLAPTRWTAAASQSWS